MPANSTPSSTTSVAAPAGGEVKLTLEMLTSILQEIKKPYIDPDLEARKQRDKLRLREQIARSMEEVLATQKACPHIRDDGTSTFAWMRLYNPVPTGPKHVGVCQRCNRQVWDTEADYARLVRIPVRGRNVVGV